MNDSKNKEQQKVRQRAGFLCENPHCRKSTMGYYAHILPESWEGKYQADNLLFLCQDCHRKYDYSILRMNNIKVLEYLHLIQDSGTKKRDRISESFQFFSDRLVVKIGEGIRLENCDTVFRKVTGEPLLSVKLDNNRFILNGTFYGSNDNILLSIKNSIFEAPGDELWDLIISNNGELDLIDVGKDIYINIKQDKDYSLYISGKIFIEGDIFQIDNSGIYQPERNNRIVNCKQYDGKGIVLSSKIIAF